MFCVVHLRKFITAQTFCTFTYSFEYLSVADPSVLTYGLIIWGQTCKTYLKKCLILQKRVLRLMYFTDRNQHAIPLFIKANTMPPSFLYYQSVSNA